MKRLELTALRLRGLASTLAQGLRDAASCGQGVVCFCSFGVLLTSNVVSLYYFGVRFVPKAAPRMSEAPKMSKGSAQDMKLQASQPSSGVEMLLWIGLREKVKYDSEIVLLVLAYACLAAVSTCVCLLGSSEA